MYCARPAGRLWVSDVPTGAVRRVLQLMPSAEEPALVGRIPTTSSGRSAHEFGRLHRLGPVRERNTCQGLSLRPLLPFRQRLMPFPAVLLPFCQRLMPFLALLLPFCQRLMPFLAVLQGLVSVGTDSIHTLSLEPVEVAHWAHIPSGMVDAAVEPESGVVVVVCDGGKGVFQLAAVTAGRHAMQLARAGFVSEALEVARDFGVSGPALDGLLPVVRVRYPTDRPGYDTDEETIELLQWLEETVAAAAPLPPVVPWRPEPSLAPPAPAPAPAPAKVQELEMQPQSQLEVELQPEPQSETEAKPEQQPEAEPEPPPSAASPPPPQSAPAEPQLELALQPPQESPSDEGDNGLDGLGHRTTTSEFEAARGELKASGPLLPTLKDGAAAAVVKEEVMVVEKEAETGKEALVETEVATAEEEEQKHEAVEEQKEQEAAEEVAVEQQQEEKEQELAVEAMPAVVTAHDGANGLDRTTTPEFLAARAELREYVSPSETQQPPPPPTPTPPVEADEQTGVDWSRLDLDDMPAAPAPSPTPQAATGSSARNTAVSDELEWPEPQPASAPAPAPARVALVVPVLGRGAALENAALAISRLLADEDHTTAFAVLEEQLAEPDLGGPPAWLLQTFTDFLRSPLPDADCIRWAVAAHPAVRPEATIDCCAAGRPGMAVGYLRVLLETKEECRASPLLVQQWFESMLTLPATAVVPAVSQIHRADMLSLIRRASGFEKWAAVDPAELGALCAAHKFYDGQLAAAVASNDPCTALAVAAAAADPAAFGPVLAACSPPGRGWGAAVCAAMRAADTREHLADGGRCRLLVELLGMLAAEAGVEAALAAVGELGEWVSRWPVEVSAAIEGATKRQLAQEVAEARLLQELNRHLWRRPDTSLPSQLSLVRQAELAGTLGELPYVNGRALENFGGGTATRKADLDAVFLADLGQPIPRAPEDIRTHWGLHSVCGHCPCCGLSVGAGGAEAELFAFRCGHIYHAPCATGAFSKGQYCVLCTSIDGEAPTVL